MADCISIGKVHLGLKNGVFPDSQQNFRIFPEKFTSCPFSLIHTLSVSGLDLLYPLSELTKTNILKISSFKRK